MHIDRLSEIRQYLYTHGQSSIQDLATHTGASLPTIRRDLFRLEEEGAIEREHGWARIAQQSSTEIAFELRASQRIEEKRAIAEAAYLLLRPNTTVFFDAGTTVQQLARKLRSMPIPLTVFTNGLALIQELKAIPGVSVHLIGGALRIENLSMVGPLAELMLEKVWFDQAFIGCSAIADDGVIHSIDLHEATLNAKTLLRSSKKIFLADSKKFGTRAPYVVCGLTDINRIISDSGLSEPWRKKLEKLSVPVTLADAMRVKTGGQE
jgi:DeoR family fructose operon transcriptional repressor